MTFKPKAQVHCHGESAQLNWINCRPIIHLLLQNHFTTTPIILLFRVSIVVRVLVNYRMCFVRFVDQCTVEQTDRNVMYVVSLFFVRDLSENTERVDTDNPIRGNGQRNRNRSRKLVIQFPVYVQFCPWEVQLRISYSPYVIGSAFNCSDLIVRNL